MIRWQATEDHPLIGRPSAIGLLLGALFFAASLTPSLIPRAGLVQGVLGGICFASGYLIGFTLIALWDWAVEPAPRSRLVLRRSLRVAVAVGGLAAAWALWNATGWQNGIHAAMGIAPVESARPFTILSVAAIVAVALIFVGRLFRRLWRMVAAQLEPFFPRRLAVVIGLSAAFFLFWSVGSDMVVGRLLAGLDETYAALDDLIPPELAPPADPGKAGSPASLADWEGLGAAGRAWVIDPPTAADISAITGTAAREPLRIYIGLNNAETAASRAALALAEAKRAGAFDRDTLVIATPTGTGWMDPAGMRPLEYLTGGDVATIAVQYSYLPSWMSLFLQPEYGSESAHAVFAAIYGHWRSLPRDDRPRLYLFGLSLGTRNSELSVSMPDMLTDPFQGALWAGPPFAADGWQQLLAARRPESLAWAPRLRDGSVIRVTTQQNLLPLADAPWGAVRLVYLEYPSDPIVFFSPDILWRSPDWLEGERGPDVSPGLRWIPVVTFLQLGFDMLTATSTPPGRGHVYAAKDYLTAWAEVLAADWPPERLEVLKAKFSAEGL